ncbi:beta family protein [Sphingobium sp. 3R8]|uniref:beta family protein n=1 Tax=Sphingobium sp. 3R8 TaxID=2874921 RepID=UPI001CCF0E1F|nr:beta family protein [Sphingobium sp. 3R8]MBZ9649391.1 beta family protein [Sphingobium sp. 3R8]
MALRNLDEIPYLPLLSLYPAEMRALEELPGQTKDALLPIVHLRPWSSSHNLDRGLERLALAYGERPCVISLADPDSKDAVRPVHHQLNALRQPAEAYANWCAFIEVHPNFIPAVQLQHTAELPAQVQCLHKLGRGLFVIVPKLAFGALDLLAATIAANSDGGRDVIFVLDFGRASRDHLQAAAICVGYINSILSRAPAARVSISASSFPEGFKDLTEQAIYERLLFNEVRGQIDTRSLIYSDRGSVRAEKQLGGGGTPAPRIDYPLQDNWKFFRSDDFGFAAYQSQASALMRDTSCWDPTLRVWGTQMIERTAAGDMSAISNPNKATAARVNLHLQVQCFYGDPGAARDTEEDWDL